MNAITTMNPYSDSPSFLLLWVIDLIFASTNDEDTVAADAEACEGFLALLAHVAVYGHEVFGSVEKTDAGFRLDMWEEAGYECGNVGWKGCSRVFGV